MPEFCTLVQTASQLAPFAVGLALGQWSLTMFAQTVAHVEDVVGQPNNNKEPRRNSVFMMFISCKND